MRRLYTFEDAKYTLRIDEEGMTAKRYGEEWRDLTGDKMVLSILNAFDGVLDEREEAREELAHARALLSELRDSLDDVDPYGTPIYREVGRFLDGEE